MPRLRWWGALEPWMLAFVLLTVATTGLHRSCCRWPYAAGAAVANLASAAVAGVVAYQLGFTPVIALGVVLMGLRVLLAVPLLAAVPREAGAAPA